MIDLFDEQARQHFAAQRAALDAAQQKADPFAHAELDAASARLSALADRQARLGPQPTPEAYASAEEWSAARDQHTFAASRYARDIAEAEQRVNALR